MWAPGVGGGAKGSRIKATRAFGVALQVPRIYRGYIYIFVIYGAPGSLAFQPQTLLGFRP